MLFAPAPDTAGTYVLPGPAVARLGAKKGTFLISVENQPGAAKNAVLALESPKLGMSPFSGKHADEAEDLVELGDLAGEVDGAVGVAGVGGGEAGLARLVEEDALDRGEV
jgi:hypothetical protein